ncbi:MAG: hypothetical protein MK095_04160, partial [Phycisphaerales bacterium]|nr:hypothetical protein [Phycisphaerales bacterium]
SVPLTLPKSSILKIERDVTVEDPKESAPAAKASDADSSSESGITEVPLPNGEVASLYIIKMQGEIGTDIRSEVYEGVIEEIKSTRPEVVIIELDSKISDDNMLSYWLGRSADNDNWWEEDPFQRREPIGMLMDDEQKLVLMFQRIPKDVRQVLWVRDATGPAALLAMSWEDMFMHSEASIGQLGEIWSTIDSQGYDGDVRSKMELAWFGAAKGMMQYGRHPEELYEGLLRPYAPLSFSCKGRKPLWFNNYDGDIPIVPEWGFGGEITNEPDGQRGFPLGWKFGARPSEDMLISDGTADTLDDLALLLDLREYDVLESDSIDDVASYREEWREQFLSAEKSMKEYIQYMQRGTMADLQKAKKALARVISRVRSNKSVATRIQSLYRMDRIELEIAMERLESQIRQQGRGGGRGGGGRGGGGRGGGGGGG